MKSIRTKIFSHNIKVIIIFFVTGTIACFISLSWLSAAYVDGQYIPLGPDSFYHASRILDSINNREFYQFDPKIHAPEGSLLTWPWVYDFTIFKFTEVILKLFNVADPMAIITYIPSIWVYFNALILLGVATLLGLSLPLRALVLICFAVSPLTLELHGAGRIDHHYMEYTMVLIALLFGIYWFKSPDSLWRSVLLGGCLGIAPSINNGLFILQLPILITFFLLWTIDKVPNKKSISLLGGTLILATLLILLPSKPFIDGEKYYYYLSWFHLYIACSSVLILAYLSTKSYSPKRLFILVILCLVLSADVGSQLYMGSQFLVGSIIKYDEISETNSVFQQYSKAGFYNLLRTYSGLLLAAPIMLLVMIIKGEFRNSVENLYFVVFALFGFLLLLFQHRMHYFGSFVLYLPMIFIFHAFVKDKKPIYWAILITGVVVCYVPSYQKLFDKLPEGKSLDYALTRHIYSEFSKVCNEDPGIVLADYDDGHYIRFHTTCSVIANNMIITPQHQHKVIQVENLFTNSAEELREKERWIKYVYVRRQDNILGNESDTVIHNKNPGLRQELLLKGSDFPEGFKLLKELVLASSTGGLIPYARLFKITHSPNL